MRVLLTRDRRHAARCRRPAAVRHRRRATSPTQLKGRTSPTRSGTRQDDTTFWPNGPQPAAYTALLKAAYPAIKGADPAATRARRRPRRQRLRVRREALRQRRQGLLRRRRRAHGHRLPDHRPARVLPRAERAHRALLVHRLPRGAGDDARPRRRQAGVDDRARLGDAPPRICSRGGRAGTKAAASRQAEQADFLAKAYGCLANDPWVEQAAWFNLHDLQTGSTDDSLNLGLITDSFARKPAFAAFQRAGSRRRRSPCGGTLDQGAPVVTMHAPTDGAHVPHLAADPRHRHRHRGRQRHRPAWSTARRSRSRRSRAAPAPRSSSSGAARRTSPTARTRSSPPRATRPRTRAARVAKVLHVGGGSVPVQGQDRATR